MRRQVTRGSVGRVAAAVVIVGTVIAGCGSGPSQVGTAAIVGDTVVPSSLVRDRVQAALSHADIVERLTADGGVVPADIARDIVTQSVVHELAQRAAAQAGIVITPAEVDAELARLGPESVQVALFAPEVLRERLADELIQRRLAAAQVNTLAVVVDAVELESEAEAEAVARDLAAGGARAAAVLDAHPDAPLRGTELRAAVRPDFASSVLFGTPAGGAGWFPGPSGSWIAFRVIDRRVDAVDEDAPDVVPLLSAEDLTAIGKRLLQPIAMQSGIEINPRYGVWDPIVLRVRAADDAVGVVLPPSAP